MNVKIGVTWEGLVRPTLARSLLSSLTPRVQESIVFLNTVWLPPYTQDVFSLEARARVCGLDAPALPQMFFLQPGPTTPPTAFVPAAALKALAKELGRLLDHARDLATSNTQVRDNLALLFAFDGFAFSDVELLNLMDAKDVDPLTSLTDELRLTHAKTLVERLLQPDCRLYQITYGPYIFLRDDSPTLWGASRLVYAKDTTPHDRFFKSRAQQDKVLTWQQDQVVLTEAMVAPLKSSPLCSSWQPASIRVATHNNPTQVEPLTACFVKIGKLSLTLALGKADKSTKALSEAQDLNMMNLGEDVQKYWRHTILRASLGEAAKRGDHRVYLLVVSAMDVTATLKALSHYAKGLSGSPVHDIVLVALDRATLGEFAKVMGCALQQDLPTVVLDDGLIRLLNHQAKELLK